MLVSLLRRPLVTRPSLHYSCYCHAGQRLFRNQRCLIISLQEIAFACLSPVVPEPVLPPASCWTTRRPTQR
jgi:hypothetical protein